MSRSFAFTGAHITFRLRARRLAWHIVWLLLYRPSPRPFHAWRRLLLRAFGARIAAGAVPYAAARIWAPWNLTMAVNSCLSDDVDCYCVAPITIGSITPSNSGMAMLQATWAPSPSGAASHSSSFL